MSNQYLPQPWNPSSEPTDAGLLAPRYAAETGDTQEQESILRLALDFLGLIRRNLVLILACIALAVAAAYYQTRNERPRYRANAVIQITNKAQTLSSGLAAQPTLNTGDQVLSQVQVLESRAVAREVVRREGLRLQPATRELKSGLIQKAQVDDTTRITRIHLVFSPDGVAAQALGIRAQGQYGDELRLAGSRFVIAADPGIPSADLQVLPTETAATQVAANLTAQPRDRTSIVDVAYVADDAVAASRIVNAAVQAFVGMSAQSDKQASVRRRDFIEKQLEKTETTLSEAQLAYNNFLGQNKLYSAEDKFKERQSSLSSIDLREQELKSDRRTYSSMLERLQNPGLSTTAQTEQLALLVASPGIASNPLVMQLYNQFTRAEAARDSITIGPAASARNSPDVQRLDTVIATTRSRLLSAAQSQIALTDGRLTALEDLKAGVSRDIATLPDAQAQQGALLTQVDTYKKQAERLRDALQSAQIEEAAQAGQVEIVDLSSLPGAPLNGGKAPKFIFAILLGLGLGAILAYVFENHRAVIRRRDELEQAVHLPSLALIPRAELGATTGSASAVSRLLGRGGDGKRSNGNARSARSGPQVFSVGEAKELVTVLDPRSTAAEAYRTLRTNLLFSAALGSVKRLVITSAAPQEGKSTTAANLAVVFAQQGHSVLLLDCDLRRPRVHRIFHLPQVAGLTDTLVGQAKLDLVIQPTGVERLKTLTAGTVPPNPAELLGSARMQKLLETLDQMFDLIIIDTPPLLAASDAAILGRVSDGALLVVRAGQAQRGAVQQAVQQLTTVGARVIGTVLNDPDAEVAKYAPYYEYQYSKQYSYAEEDV